MVWKEIEVLIVGWGARGREGDRKRWRAKSGTYSCLIRFLSSRRGMAPAACTHSGGGMLLEGRACGVGVQQTGTEGHRRGATDKKGGRKGGQKVNRLRPDLLSRGGIWPQLPANISVGWGLAQRDDWEVVVR